MGALHRDVGVAVGASADVAGEVEAYPELPTAHGAGGSRFLRLARVLSVAHDAMRGGAPI